MEYATRVKRRLVNSLIEQHTINKNYPIEVIQLNSTRGCNSRCITCHLWKKKLTKLTMDNFEKGLDIISLFTSKSKKVSVNFTSEGEALLNEKIYDMMKVCSSKGFETLLTTNSLLVTEHNAEKILKSGVKNVCFSLESTTPEVNDKIRGVKGHYDSVMKSIQSIDLLRKKYNIDCNMSVLTTVSSYNISGLLDIVKWVNINPKLASIGIQAVSPIFGAKTSLPIKDNPLQNHLWPKQPEQVEKVYNELISLKKSLSKLSNTTKSLMKHKEYFLNSKILPEPTRMCNIYKSTTMNPDGQIFLCPMIDTESMPFKNIILTKVSKDNHDTELLKQKIVEIQNKIRSCNASNCHVLLNCQNEDV